jgi:hypothetical protein
MMETFRAKLVFPDPDDPRFGRLKWVDIPLSDDIPPWVLRIPRERENLVDVFERQDLSTRTLDVEYDYVGTTPRI